MVRPEETEGDLEAARGSERVCPLIPAQSAQRQPPKCGGRGGGRGASPPLQGWLLGRDSALATRLAGAQIRDLRNGSGWPQGPSRPTFPDSLGSMAPFSVTWADPSPADRPEEGAAAATLGTGAPGVPGGAGSPAGREREPLPRWGAVAL